ncbi:hypothetical protein ZWY2020_050872 [Hordeum vulgare]|nr:hypothetical protein ZWY2020_050872 [Hordeum vulgare]
MCREILFGALSFIIYDSAWLWDTPLDVEALPTRGATHFRAGARGVLVLQQSAPVSTFAPVARRNKRSCLHAQARQSASSQVAVLESVVVAPPSQRSDSVPTEFPSEYVGRGLAAEVHMANSHESPRQTGQNKHEVGETSGARRHRCSPRTLVEQRGGVPHTPQPGRRQDSRFLHRSIKRLARDRADPAAYTAAAKFASRRTTGSTIVLFARTHIGQFTAPVLISDTGEAAVP